MASRIRTEIDGVFYRQHPTRECGRGRNRHPDRYYLLRYSNSDGQQEEGIGWESRGYTLEYAGDLMRQIREGVTSGKGPRSLREIRTAADVQRQADREASAERQLAQIRDGVTFAQAAGRYLTWAKENKLTSPDDEGRLNNHILPELGPLRLAEITPERVNLLKNAVARKKPLRGPGKHLAAGTVLHVLALVRSIFNFALVTPLDADTPHLKLFTGANPAAFSRYSIGATLPKKDNAALRVIFPEEFDMLLEAACAWSQDAYDVALIGWHTGMRLGEIVPLERQHVSLRGMAITVLDPKSGQSRLVDYPADLQPALKRRMAAARPHLFPARNLRKHQCPHINSSSFSSLFKELTDMIGLNRDVTDPRLLAKFKSLRTTYAVRMLAAGMDLRTLQAQLGHADITTTARHYLPLVQVWKKEAVTRATERGKVLDFSSARH